MKESISAFRACHERFTACVEYQSLRTGSPMNATVDSFVLDFDLASKRAFGNCKDRYRVFQLHFLEGMSAADICRELGMERFALASEICQIEKLAGQAFIERGLFPLQSYFGESVGTSAGRRAA